MTRWGQRWAGTAFVAALLLVGGVGFLSHQSTTELAATAEWVRHTHQVLEAIERVNGFMWAAEAVERGYVLTGERRYAEEFENVAARLDEALLQALQLTEDNPEQHHRLTQLQEIARQRIPELRTVLRVRETKGAQVAWKAAAGQEGRKLMPFFRGVVREARAVEQKHLEERSTQARAEARRTWYTVMLGNVLAFVLIGLAVMAIQRDHRKRRLAEDALQQANERLELRVEERTTELALANEVLRLEARQREHAEEQIRDQAALIDKVRDAVFVQDLDGAIRFWNRGAERVYGWSSAEVLGRKAEAVFHPANSAPPEDAERELARRGEWAGEVRHATRDGKEIVVESQRTLLRDAQGAPAGQLVMNHDITERKKLEGQFRRTQRLESIGMLAGGIAHDLNNVLTPILMSSKLLRKDRPETQRLGMLDTIQASAERGAGMVRQLLAFAGGMESERAPVHLKSVVKEIQHLLTHTFPKAITLQIQVPEDAWLVQGDPTQLSQVLMNLCVNARDAMPHGGTLAVGVENRLLDANFVRVHVEAHAGPYVLVTVTDTGVGIAPALLDRIFDPFFTTKEHGKGTGLGLASALGIVKGHGGFITVYSEVGKGTRFALYLPAVESTETEQARREMHAVPLGAGQQILVVDDEPFIVVTAKATLEDNGYRVHTASHGQEALDVFRRCHADVQAVVLDLMMPGLDTPSVLRGLHEIDPRVRVLASSGLRPAGAVADAVAKYARAFLQKPYSDGQLLEALATVLDSKDSLV